jgi:H+-translocating NAD(P) transhydrogenase subunit alpha
MKIGIPREVAEGENRVALIPAMVPTLQEQGFEVLVTRSAGERAFFSDKSYEDAGAVLVDGNPALYKESDIIFKVRPPTIEGENEVNSMKAETLLICLLDPFFNRDLIAKLAEQKINAMALEFIPRITRAQSMDVLSSMASIAGYKSVLEAASKSPRYFPMLMTAAGTITPAKVFIIGAGVAGLMAIATARRLGGVVEAYDTRPVVKEQVESLGAKFVEFDLEVEEAQDSGGYAKSQSDEFYRKQREAMTRKLAESDVVITTALVPGKKAPVLITSEMLKEMKPGSVVVDLAAEKGGNVEGTVADKIVEVDSVFLIGYTDFPSRTATHASQLYSKNVTSLLLSFVKEGKVSLDREDEIVEGTLLTYEGEVIHKLLKESVPEEKKEA